MASDAQRPHSFPSAFGDRQRYRQAEVFALNELRARRQGDGAGDGGDRGASPSSAKPEQDLQQGDYIMPVVFNREKVYGISRPWYGQCYSG